MSTRSARVDALTCRTTVDGALSAAAAAAVSTLDGPEQQSVAGAGELLSPRLVLDRDSEVGDGSPSSSKGDNTRPPFGLPEENRLPATRLERPKASSTTPEDRDEMLLPIGRRTTWSAIGSVCE